MNWFSYTLKKSPFFRFFIFIIFVVFVVFALRLAFKAFSDKPSITSVFPMVVNSGDKVTITGENFGKPDEVRGLRFGDDFLPSSSCISWNDTAIIFTVPKNFKTSLVSVSVGNEVSEKKVLTERSELPTVLQKQFLVSLPEITSISRNHGSVGQSITIYGENFGATRQNSTVIFTEKSEEMINENTTDIEGVYCNEAEYDFVNWSDNEITIHIPDGAMTGNLVVQTISGLSNFIPFRVSTREGKKTLSNKRSIVISLEASVQDIVPRSNQNALFLLMPQPIESYRQKNIVLSSTAREPFARNFQNSNIYRFENLNDTSQLSISEKIKLETYDTNVKVNVSNISNTLSLKPEILKYTNSQLGIPSDDNEIKEITKKITGGNKNPYNNAKKIYDYLLENIKPTTRSVKDAPNVINCLRTGKADAYEFSLIYCTLMRSLSVPCIQISGVIVNRDRTTHLHWWNEFYIEGIGWIPVDIALALGQPYNLGLDASEFFASIDGLHIAFSRDIETQTQMLSESMIVTKSKSFAIRKIWEESTGLVAYNSLWTIPKVISIY